MAKKHQESPHAQESDPELDLLNRGFRCACALPHHREDAENFTQEAWLNLSRRHGKISSPAMRLTSIKNLVIDRYRRSKIVAFESADLDETLAGRTHA